MSADRACPHWDKLRELRDNDKLPDVDLPRLEALIAQYESWIAAMEAVTSSGDARVVELVDLLADYKRKVELFAWDSPADFLWRQKGQLKLDNSVLEEFLPWVVDDKTVPGLSGIDHYAGPASAFASVYFEGTMTPRHLGMRVRLKDQDFTLSRPTIISARFADEPAMAQEKNVYVAYVAAEIKTNLDKTMFQEACATAHDLKTAMPGAKYYLLCEFLDMTPVSTAGTDIDEVIVLRGKRTASNIRANWSKAEQRCERLAECEEHVLGKPVLAERILRFVEHIRDLVDAKDPEENDVLGRGYF